MKTQIIDINSAAEFDAFTEKHKKGHFLQTSLWARVKDDWKWFGVICRNDSGEITGTMGVLLRKISKLPFHMMYAPRGPVCDFDDKETFSALIEAAKQEGKKYNAYELKIDKDATSEMAVPAANLLVRGNINAEPTPALVIVDGVEKGTDTSALNLVKPEEIESITVMKSPEAIKAYGEKGKDGVIKIQTKKNK